MSLTDPVSGDSALRYTEIYDWRAQKYMLTVEVDLDKLGRAPGYPANGIVYWGAFQPDVDFASWPGGGAGVGPAEWAAFPAPWASAFTEFAFKTRHSSTLTGDLTIVTENPMYMQGDYNTIGKKGAAVMADAITLLSNNWGDIDGDGYFDDDLDYSLLDLSLRNALTTTMNAALMTGNVDVGASYNGGLENLPRLLERWTNVELNLLGSLAARWESKYATGTFDNGGVYSAPIRNWDFDTDFLDLAKLPPATPRIYQFAITGWSRY